MCGLSALSTSVCADSLLCQPLYVQTLCSVNHCMCGLCSVNPSLCGLSALSTTVHADSLLCQPLCVRTLLCQPLYVWTLCSVKPCMCGLSALAGFNHNCSKERGGNTGTEDNIYYAVMDEDELSDRCYAVEVHLILKLLDCTGPQTMFTVVVVSMLTQPRNCGVQQSQRCVCSVKWMRLGCKVPAFPLGP